MLFVNVRNRYLTDAIDKAKKDANKNPNGTNDFVNTLEYIQNDGKDDIYQVHKWYSSGVTLVKNNRPVTPGYDCYPALGTMLAFDSYARENKINPDCSVAFKRQNQIGSVDVIIRDVQTELEDFSAQLGDKYKYIQTRLSTARNTLDKVSGLDSEILTDEITERLDNVEKHLL